MPGFHQHGRMRKGHSALPASSVRREWVQRGDAAQKVSWSAPLGAGCVPGFVTASGHRPRLGRHESAVGVGRLNTKWSTSGNHTSTQSQEHREGSLARPGPPSEAGDGLGVQRGGGWRESGSWASGWTARAWPRCYGCRTPGSLRAGWRVGWVSQSWAFKEELKKPLWNTWAGVKPLRSEVLASCIIDLMDLGLRKRQEVVKPACCSPWGCKELDLTERQNTTNDPASCLWEGLFFASWDLHGCSVGSHWETLQGWSCQRRRASKNSALNGADWQMLSHPCGSLRSVDACIFQLASGTLFSCKLFHVSDSLSDTTWTATPWTIARQAPLSMEISRQESWSGLPFPSPGNLPDSGILPGPPELQADSLPS